LFCNCLELQGFQKQTGLSSYCTLFFRPFTVRGPGEVRWKWGGHQRLRCALSQNIRPPLQHYSHTQCTLLETTGVQCV
jgi:hypothetical protein